LDYGGGFIAYDRRMMLVFIFEYWWNNSRHEQTMTRKGRTTSQGNHVMTHDHISLGGINLTHPVIILLWLKQKPKEEHWDYRMNGKWKAAMGVLRPPNQRFYSIRW
jgi:hypothetical protein